MIDLDCLRFILANHFSNFWGSIVARFLDEPFKGTPIFLSRFQCRGTDPRPYVREKLAQFQRIDAFPQLGTDNLAINYAQPAVHEPAELWKAARARQPQAIHPFRIRPLSVDEKMVEAIVRKQTDSGQLLFMETVCGRVVCVTGHWLFIFASTSHECRSYRTDQIKAITPGGRRVELDVDEGKRWPNPFGKVGKIVVEAEDEDVVERLTLLLKSISILQGTAQKK
jgi:hypothetical protein